MHSLNVMISYILSFRRQHINFDDFLGLIFRKIKKQNKFGRDFKKANFFKFNKSKWIVLGPKSSICTLFFDLLKSLQIFVKMA